MASFLLWGVDEGEPSSSTAELLFDTSACTEF